MNSYLSKLEARMEQSKSDNQTKQPKQPKQPKEPKPPKESKPPKEPKQKELTEEEYINGLINEKNLLIKKKMDEIKELDKIICGFRSRVVDDVILNERRNIINKSMLKLPKKDKDNDEKKELYNELFKYIKKFDNYFNIRPDQLNEFDLK
jgi:hypothetical protein